jgi:molybdopterin converting factor small subunit
MNIEVRIPPVLRKHTGGSSSVKVVGGTVAQVLEAVEDAHPGFKSQITDGSGDLHRFINVYRNGEDIRFLQQLDTSVAVGDVVAILPAVAGG